MEKNQKKVVVATGLPIINRNAPLPRKKEEKPENKMKEKFTTNLNEGVNEQRHVDSFNRMDCCLAYTFKALT